MMYSKITGDGHNLVKEQCKFCMQFWPWNIYLIHRCSLFIDSFITLIQSCLFDSFNRYSLSGEDSFANN